MQYTSTINWERGSVPFTAKSYDRTHTVTFGGGESISCSSAPEFLGKAELPNPEELFVSSISSCFMLTFLYWAAMKGLNIDQYQAEAIGKLAKNEEGKMAMTEVTIKPSIMFHGNQQPDPAVMEELFNKAHANCFISCSVKTTVRVEHGTSVAS